MADFMLIVLGIVGFFAVAAALVVGCDRIVGEDDPALGPVEEVHR